MAALLVRTSLSDAKVTREQILGAIYGKASLTRPSSPQHYECLYFAESAFFRYRKRLDAAIVICPDDATLCLTLYLNDYGSRLERVRQSKLAQFFAEKRALYDVAEWERQNKDSLIADCDTPRSDVRKTIEYLEHKYGIKGLRKLDLKRWAGISGIGISGTP